MDRLPTTPDSSVRDDLSRSLDLPDISRAHHPVGTLEPSSDEIALAEHAGIDPWFFEGDNVSKAFDKLWLIDKQSLSNIVSFLDGIDVVGNLACKRTDDCLLVADTLHPAEAELLEKAKAALAAMRAEDYTPTKVALSVAQKIRATGSVAMTSSGVGVAMLSLPVWAQAGMYGLAAGGVALGVPVVKEVWREVRDIIDDAKRGKECVELLSNLEKKLDDAGSFMAIPDTTIELDIDRIKRSTDPDYLAFKQTIVEHGKSLELPKKTFGQAVLATLFSGGLRAVQLRTLEINPADATTRLIENVQETNPEYLSALWSGTGKVNGIKPIIEEIVTAKMKLDRQVRRQDTILAIDNDTVDEKRDDVQTVRSLEANRHEAQKGVDIAVLRLVKLRQDAMRYLGEHKPGQVVHTTWPLLEQ